MKKIVIFTLAVCMVVSLAACGGSSSDNSSATTAVAVTTDEAAEEETKTDTEAVEEETETDIAYEITYQNYMLYEDYSGDVHDYVIVQVKNTGTKSLYLKDATFSYMDEDGNLAGVDSGLISSDPDIIEPGEYGYFYSNMGSVGGDLSVDGNYTMIPELSIQESKKDPIPFEISNTSISSGKTGPVTVIGQITNDTDEDESMVWIAFVFFDEDDNPIGACGTNVMNLAAGSTQSFSADAIYLSRLDFTVDDVSHYDVYAFKTQYQF